MPTSTIIIIAVIVVVCVVGMIVAMKVFGAAKEKAKAFKAEALRSGAVVNCYGEIISVDGNKPIRGQDFVTGGDMETVLRLAPGAHHFQAKFSTTETRLGGNKTFDTGQVDFDAQLQHGVEYTIGLYEDQGDPSKTITLLEMQTSGVMGHTWYLTLEAR